MATKIRLQRQGRKKRPFYHIVVADSRAPRDGKFIEKIGSYLPQTQPATIDLDVNRAVYWLNNGAQPTDTCRALLSYKGALLKHHLEMGVAKGAITQEQADAKFETWVSDKANKVEQHKSRVNMSAKDQAAAKLADEAKANAARAEKIATKLAAAEAAIAAANAPAVEEVSATEEVPVTEEVPATEEAAAEATETPAE